MFLSICSTFVITHVAPIRHVNTTINFSEAILGLCALVEMVSEVATLALKWTFPDI